MKLAIITFFKWESGQGNDNSASVDLENRVTSELNL